MPNAEPRLGSNKFTDPSDAMAVNPQFVRSIPVNSLRFLQGLQLDRMPTFRLSGMGGPKRVSRYQSGPTVKISKRPVRVYFLETP